MNGEKRLSAERLCRLNDEATSSRTLEDLFKTLDTIIEEIVSEEEGDHRIDGINLFLLRQTGRGNKLELRASRGTYAAGLNPYAPNEFEPKKGVTGQTIISGHKYYAPDTEKDDHFYRARENDFYRSEFAVPIKAGGKVIGVADFSSNEVDDFSPEIREDIERIVVLISGNIARFRGEHDSIITSYDNLMRDILTARAFERAAKIALSNATNNHEGITFIRADGDGLKNLNNRYGHINVDECLRRYGGNLRERLRQGDIMGRWHSAGDEIDFVLPNSYLDSVDNPLGLEKVIEKISTPGQNLGAYRPVGIPESEKERVSLGISGAIVTFSPSKEEKPGFAEIMHVTSKFETLLKQEPERGVFVVASDPNTSALLNDEKALHEYFSHLKRYRTQIKTS